MKLWATVIVMLFSCLVVSAKQLSSPTSPDSLSSPINLDSNVVIRKLIGDTTLQPFAQSILQFYRKRNYQYQWFNSKGLNEPARSFKNMLQRYEQVGVMQYGTLWPKVKKDIRKIETGLIDSIHFDSVRLGAEIDITANFCQFIIHNFSENVNNAEEWFMPSEKLGIDTAMKKLRQLENQLGSLKFSDQLLLLTDKLNKYNDLTKEELWPPIVLPKKAYKQGDKDEIMIAIKKRVALLTESLMTDTSAMFTTELKGKILSIQKHTGITQDGIIGNEVMRVINTYPEYRIKQLLVNIQRLKWLPKITYNDYIVVNIPEFAMHVFQSEELCWSSAVVVGKPSSSTAVFSGNMKYIVFSPYWNVPPSIIKKEIIPTVKKNASYIYKERLEFTQNNKVVDASAIDWSKYPEKPFPYSVRQRPGKSNSLGLVKFLFPNEYDIYLHDTPSKALFNATSRSFSHGCIRISEPEKLATHLLRNDPSYTKEKIKNLMNGGKETWIVLKPQVPVSINYFTSWVDKNGQLNFRNDVYGFDKELMNIYFK